MKLSEAGHECTIPEPFETALKLVRAALLGAGLGILGEFDPSGFGSREAGTASTPSRILYVGSPLLLFEALALDRAAAVFLPLHVLVAASGLETRVCWIDPAAAFGARLPAGAAVPLDELQARLSRALTTRSGVEV
jgi:uncharacterized protein (DUF302 family)